MIGVLFGILKSYSIVALFSRIFSGNGRPISTKLGMLHRGLLSITVYKTDDTGVTLTYFMARSNLVIWEKVKTVDFSETIAACYLEVGRSRHLIELMEVYEY